MIKPRAMRDALLERIWERMETDPTIFMVAADFGSPVLDKVRSDFPERFINVGIAEQNLINISAGLALEGYTVFAYSIAPFITMRCYEQTRVSLALLSEVRSMNVNLIGVGAGFSYVVSGPTHQCYEDLSLMRAMPNFRVLSPSDHVTSAALLDTCLNNQGPKYLRLDAQVLPVLYKSTRDVTHQGFSVHKKGDRLALVATGYALHTALEVASNLEQEGVELGVIDIVDLSNFSRSAFLDAIDGYSTLVSLEEGFKGRGGLDSMLFDFLSNESQRPRLVNLGVEGGYRFELGSRLELHEAVGIGPTIVGAKVRAALAALNG